MPARVIGSELKFARVTNLYSSDLASEFTSVWIDDGTLLRANVTKKLAQLRFVARSVWALSRKANECVMTADVFAFS